MPKQNQHLSGEVATLMRELRQVATNAKTRTSRILTVATEPLIGQLNVASPIGKKVHKRYSTTKLVKSIRAPRGKGQVAAIYHPRNLALSFTRFRFKGAKYSLQVGAKLAKGSAQGNFGGFSGRYDGYYLHMVEFGTIKQPAQPFVRPTWSAMREPVKNDIVRRLQQVIKRIKKV